MSEIPESSVTYEQLADLEREFDDVEAEIIRQQVKLSQPLYEKRAVLVAKIPNFWPLVLEQAPPEVDEYIQPSDSAILLASLKSVSVEHFEIDAGGDPRSISIKWEFAENEYFEDTVLEKKFWYRHDKSLSWSGLVSEPVEVKWKEGKDLTEGMLSLVKKVWDEEQAGIKAGKEVKGWTETRNALREKIDATGMGGVSFFAWFGFIGRRVSAEESVDADKRERERRRLRSEGKEVAKEEEEEEEGEEETEEDIQEELEIFPGGDDLAVAVSEDLWPAAIKHFTLALEQENMSDFDFESDDEVQDVDIDEVEEDTSAPPKKKAKV
ncbi:related to phosphatase 2a inhibitor [Cephalotrichum gorgonifer]|uniref:Related to phosphatase 2a inhibitor n=1 Tax=Cephalotrichum gorgonifer TaxID=2041049 RepID=A0AAE8SRH9_9PEZI|nr:related to phosphatase 2a inhibitor [Cephalotrichum gorgonifer]